MLKGNLSTRPFYNDRLVAITIAVIAVAVVALTAFNATQLRSLSTQRSGLRGKIDKDVNDARSIERKTRELMSSIDAPAMKLLTNSVHETNDLIDQRTFSWTTFLSVIEKTLPYDVRLVEVAPKPEKGVMHVGITVVCKTSEDLFPFVEALEKSRVFSDIVPAARNPNDDGTETALIEAVYLASSVAPPAPPPAKKAGKGRP
jgi:hypothetical protein